MSVQPTTLPTSARPHTGLAEESASGHLVQRVATLAAILRRRMWFFILPLLAGIIISLIISMTLPRDYYVLALFERKNDLVVTRLISANTPYSFESLRKTLKTDLSGLGSVAAALNELGMTDDLPRDEEGKLTPEGQTAQANLVRHFAMNSYVKIQEQSPFVDLVEFSYTGNRPAEAALVLKKLRERYTEITDNQVNTIVQDAYEYFSRKAEQSQDQLEAVRAQLHQIELEHPGTDPSNGGILEQKLLRVQDLIESLSSEKRSLVTQITKHETYLQELQQRGTNQPVAPRDLSTGSTQVHPNPDYLRLREQIKAKQQEIEEATSVRKMRPQHPKVVQMFVELEQLRGQLANESEYLPSPAMTPNATTLDPVSFQETERKRAKLELESLRNALATSNSRLEDYKAERERLQHEKSTLFSRREVYLKLEQQLKDIERDHALWSEHVTTLNRVLSAEADNRGIQIEPVEDPHIPTRPISPTVFSVMSVSGGIGLALAAACVFLREAFDRSFRNPQRIRQSLGIPVLETIGEVHVGRPPGWFWRRRFLPAVAFVQVLAVVALAAMVYLSLEKPNTYKRIVSQAQAQVARLT